MRTPRRSLYLRTLAAALAAVALGVTLVPCTAFADIPAVAQTTITIPNASTAERTWEFLGVGAS